MSGIAQRTPPAVVYREYEFWAAAAEADTEGYAMELAGEISGINVYYPMFPGTIIGLGAMMGGQQNAGDIIVTVQRNYANTLMHLTIPDDVPNPYALLVRGSVQFAAGDSIAVSFDTTSDFDGLTHFGVSVGVLLELDGI